MRHLVNECAGLHTCAAVLPFQTCQSSSSLRARTRSVAPSYDEHALRWRDGNVKQRPCSYRSASFQPVSSSVSSGAHQQHILSHAHVRRKPLSIREAHDANDIPFRPGSLGCMMSRLRLPRGRRRRILNREVLKKRGYHLATAWPHIDMLSESVPVPPHAFAALCICLVTGPQYRKVMCNPQLSRNIAHSISHLSDASVCVVGAAAHRWVDANRAILESCSVISGSPAGSEDIGPPLLAFLDLVS